MENEPKTARTGPKKARTTPHLTAEFSHKRRMKRDFLTRHVAEKTGYSMSMVRQVRCGTYENVEIMEALLEAQEKFKELLETTIPARQ